MSEQCGPEGGLIMKPGGGNAFSDVPYSCTVLCIMCARGAHKRACVSVCGCVRMGPRGHRDHLEMFD
jgi:hypothetical protein